MFLKSIEIHGFKSFAAKTFIDFTGGITGIVGPNGSGKSNISDAARWALGEQSAKNLRGSKMDDIIFNGTENKKSVGQATVTLTFDNKDHKLPIEYHEVAITRRLFRSGENKFYINNTECRLKDVRELFMDTGIGREGYSIIEQGKLEQILSNKPEDRRTIFEEAAGITKYKFRKDESTRKLQKVDENITRLDDLLSEIRLQDESLKEASDLASEYLLLFNEMKDIELNLFARDLKNIDEEELKLKDDLEMNRKKMSDMDVEISEKESSILQIKDKIKSVEDMIDKERELNLFFVKNDSSLKISLSQYENDIKSNLELLNNMDEMNKSYVSEKEGLSQSKNFIKLENEKLDKEKSILSEDISLKKNKLDRLKEIISSIDSSIDKTLATLNAINTNRLEIASKIDNINSIEQRIISEKEKLTDRKNYFFDEKENVEKKINDLSLKILKLQSKKDEIKCKIISIDKEIISCEQNKKNAQEEYDLLTNNLTERRTKYEVLKRLSSENEGYYKSVKDFLNILKKDASLKEMVIGTVADSIKVKEEFITAVESSLGGQTQDIIIKKSSDVNHIIASLKKNNIGRVTFLPTDTIKSGKVSSIPTDKFEEYGVIGILSELVDYPRNLKDIFAFLLGRTYLVESVDHALSLKKAFGQNLRVVTKGGELFNPGGSITGGVISKSAGIIRRNFELESLSTSIKDLEERVCLLDNKLRNENAFLSKKETEKNNLINSIEEVDRDINSYEKDRYLNISLKEQNSVDEKKTLSEIAILDDEIKKTNITREELYKKSEECIEKISITEEEINRLKNEKESASSEYDFISDELNKLKIEQNRVSMVNQSNNSSLMEMDKKDSLLAAKISECHSKKQNILAKIEELKNQIKKTQDEIANKEFDNKKRQEKLDILVKDKLKLTSSFNELDNSFSNLEKLRIELEKDIIRLEGKYERFSLKKDSIIERLENTYSFSIDEVLQLNFKKYLKKIEYPSNRIKELKQKIDSLGNVNLNSIEDYKNVHERLLFNEKQREDLIVSGNNLRSIIREMDIEMRSVFHSALDQIRFYFKEIFENLFGGGSADIYLTDDNDILESGIEIVIRPPGKKRQHLSLFSGGERSLTAVCILFALLRFRPAPFCILDEVDAALDEANIRRYIDYLKSISDIQFIIITHRKTTMEVADALYGVTMEGSGVSSVISLALEDNEVKEIV